MGKIRTLSTVAMIVVLPMLLYYPYEALSWNLSLSFLDWGGWACDDRWVDGDAQIAPGARIVFSPFGRCLWCWG